MLLLTGTSPIPKSTIMLNIIFACTSFGSPPSTCWQVRSTIIAMNASMTSPIPGIIPITEDQPNRNPQQLKRDMSSRYARLLTLVRTLPSCSEIPCGSALRLFFPLLEGLPSSRVAGTVSKYGSYIPSAKIAEVFTAETYLMAEIVGHGLPQDLLADIFCD